MSEWPDDGIDGHDQPRLPWGLPGEVIPHRRRSVKNPLSARFHEILAELGKLHDKKQADYGHATDPFANVRGSQDWCVKPWVGAMVRANDKVKRLQKVAQGGELANESVVDSFQDLAVYAIIAQVLWEEANRSKHPVGIESKKKGLDPPSVVFPG